MRIPLTNAASLYALPGGETSRFYRGVAFVIRLCSLLALACILLILSGTAISLAGDVAFIVVVVYFLCLCLLGYRFASTVKDKSAWHMTIRLVFWFLTLPATVIFAVSLAIYALNLVLTGA